MPKTNPMNSVYRRLNAFGLSRDFIKNIVLPCWWMDESAEYPAGLSRGLSLLSQNLGLDIKLLHGSSTPLHLRDFGICKFKRPASGGDENFVVARVMAIRAARIAAKAITTRFAKVTSWGREVREQIFDECAAMVGLSELLDWCWRSGIPVLHLDNFPKGSPRPDCIVVRDSGRPVIVLAQNAEFSASMLFVLAHALGHISYGHISKNEVLLDESVDVTSQDIEEEDANEFADRLVMDLDKTNDDITAGEHWESAGQLADFARNAGENAWVYPSYIALNYGRTVDENRGPLRTAAMTILEEEDKEDAAATIRYRMVDNLDWSRISPDEREFLHRVTRYDPALDRYRDWRNEPSHCCQSRYDSTAKD